MIQTPRFGRFLKICLQILRSNKSKPIAIGKMLPKKNLLFLSTNVQVTAICRANSIYGFILSTKQIVSRFYKDCGIVFIRFAIIRKCNYIALFLYSLLFRCSNNFYLCSSGLTARKHSKIGCFHLLRNILNRGYKPFSSMRISNKLLPLTSDLDPYPS